MEVQQIYSHLNGHEFLAVHDPRAVPIMMRLLVAAKGNAQIQPSSAESDFVDHLDKTLNEVGWVSAIPHHYTRGRLGLSLPYAMGAEVGVGLGVHHARYLAGITDVGLHLCWCSESVSRSAAMPYHRLVEHLRRRDTTLAAVPLVVIGIQL
jgi:hypothetical protein